MANTIPANNNTSLYNATGNATPVNGNISATNINASGNVTVGGFITANGSITTNSNFVGNLIGNVTGNVTLSGGNTEVIYNNSGVTGSSPAFTFNSASNVVSASGNVVANYYFGNGSQLTGLPATYSDANVVTLLANFGSNTISTTGNITSDYVLGNGSLLTGITANYSNANVVSLMAAFGSNAISTTGNVSADIVSASGNIVGLNLKTSGATGNIVGANYVSANFYLGDGGLLSNIGGTYSNANVTSLLAGFGSNSISTSGNITSGNLRVTSGSNTWTVVGSRLTAPAGGEWFSDVGNLDEYISSAANGYIDLQSLYANSVVASRLHLEHGLSHINVNGDQWTFDNTGNLTLPGNTSAINYANGASILSGIGGNYSNANVANYLPTFSGNIGAGNISATGNITGGNITSPGQISVAGNITTNTSMNAPQGLYVVGLLNSTVVRAGNITLDTDVIGVNKQATLRGDTITVDGTISATGNVTGNYFIGNGSQLTGITTTAGGSNTQIQFNDGTAFAGNVAMTFDKTSGNITLGNLVINANAINNINSFQSNTNPNPGRILFGAGRTGNYNPTVNTSSSRILQVDEIIKYDDGLRTAGITATLYGNLAGGNIGASNTNSRLQAAQSEMYVINGNTVNNNAFTMRGYNAGFNVGSGANTGNAFVQAGSATTNFITVFAGSTANTAINVLNGTTFNGNVGNAVGMLTTFGGSANVTANCIGFYMPGITTSIGAQSTGNGARSATNYYFVRSDDPLAKSRLGSLELYHNFTSNASPTTGNLLIDKTNGQFQQLYPTGNVTITTLQGFITRAQKPDATQVNQTDVVTLLIQQSATPYTITMPTGNANIRYANGVSTVANTANSTTIVTITGTYNYNVGGNQYLINISPEYT